MRAVATPGPSETGPSAGSGADQEDFIGCEAAGTLWGLFRERVRRSPNGLAYREYDPLAQAWSDYTWHATALRVDRFRAALARAGLRPTDRVALLLPNGLDWVCFDMAAHALGLVVVGLYPHDSPANHAYILAHCEARLLLVDTQSRWRAIAAVPTSYPALENVWIRDLATGPAMPSGPVLRRVADVLAADDPVPPASPTEPGMLATLVYTSGTVARPKGVMLSHFAVLWNAEATARIIPPRLNDVFLSILPAAHAFERTVGYYLPMMGGSAVAFARSAQTLREDLRMVRPTVMLGVPRLFERMSADIRASGRRNAVRRLILGWASSVGWQRIAAARDPTRRLGLITRTLGPLIHRFVEAQVMAAFGGRLRVAVSGGAPLDAGVARFLIGLGVPLVEGYGLTEAAPVVAASALDDSFPGSAGRALPGVEVKLTERGELLVRSPSLMMGYWKPDAETAGAIDADGWLATGDLAEIRDGRVYIVGRLKEIIVLSIGEKINPNTIEAQITSDPLFEQAAVVGERRPFLVALAVLNDTVWRRLAAECHVDPDQPNVPVVKAKILARINRRLPDFPRHGHIRAIHLSLQPWTIDSGLLTPTLKIKRDVLQRVFAREIDQLYAGPLRGEARATRSKQT